jgi:hypothetical protein
VPRGITSDPPGASLPSFACESVTNGGAERAPAEPPGCLLDTGAVSRIADALILACHRRFADEPLRAAGQHLAGVSDLTRAVARAGPRVLGEPREGLADECGSALADSLRHQYVPALTRTAAVVDPPSLSREAPTLAHWLGQPEVQLTVTVLADNMSSRAWRARTMIIPRPRRRRRCLGC